MLAVDMEFLSFMALAAIVSADNLLVTAWACRRFQPGDLGERNQFEAYAVSVAASSFSEVSGWMTKLSAD